MTAPINTIDELIANLFELRSEHPIDSLPNQKINEMINFAIELYEELKGNNQPSEDVEEDDEPVTLHCILNDIFAEARENEQVLTTLDLVEALLDRCPSELLAAMADERRLIEIGAITIARSEDYNPADDELIFIVPDDLRDDTDELRDSFQSEAPQPPAGKTFPMELIIRLFQLYGAGIAEEGEAHPNPVVKEALLAAAHSFLTTSEDVIALTRKVIDGEA